MKWRLVSILVALSLLIVIIPAPVTKAGGQPEPNCVVQGNYCVHYYQAQYTDPSGPTGNGGATLSATWGVDFNSGNIVSVSDSYSYPGGMCDLTS